MTEQCPECGTRIRADADRPGSARDLLVDHMTDVHDSFTHITETGRTLQGLER